MKDKIYSAIAIFVVVGFFITIRIMNWDLKREARRNQQQNAQLQTPDNRYVELTIRCKSAKGQQEYEAIKTGMRFQEVVKVLHLKPFTQNLNTLSGNIHHRESVLVIFKNPDGSYIETMFGMGRVDSKRRVGAPMR